MSAVVKLRGFQATFNDGRWLVSGEPELTRALNEVSEYFCETKLKTMDPDPERAIAEHVVRVFGGRVLEVSKPPSVPKTADV